MVCETRFISPNSRTSRQENRIRQHLRPCGSSQGFRRCEHSGSPPRRAARPGAKSGGRISGLPLSAKFRDCGAHLPPCVSSAVPFVHVLRLFSWNQCVTYATHAQGRSFSRPTLCMTLKSIRERIGVVFRHWTLSLFIQVFPILMQLFHTTLSVLCQHSSVYLLGQPPY